MAPCAAFNIQPILVLRVYDSAVSQCSGSGDRPRPGRRKRSRDSLEPRIRTRSARNVSALGTIYEEVAAGCRDRPCKPWEAIRTWKIVKRVDAMALDQIGIRGGVASIGDR